eukprot:scaffold36594_cov54-Phaeocystis_antarctica.AAC.1
MYPGLPVSYRGKGGDATRRQTRALGTSLTMSLTMSRLLLPKLEGWLALALLRSLARWRRSHGRWPPGGRPRSVAS